MRTRHALYLAVSLLVAACTTPYRVPLVVGKEGTEPRFRGLADLLEQQNTVDVLFIHGMCTHYPQWAQDTVRNTFASLGGDPRAVDLKEKNVEGTSVSLYQQTLNVNGRTLRANAILWSPVVADLKSQLCYDQVNKTKACQGSPAYVYQRADFNRLLKDTLLDDCLADALIYQGKARNEISAQIQKAVLQAVATSGGKQDVQNVAAAAARESVSIPVAVVTSSLGSKVIFDAIYKLSTDKETAAAGDRIVQRTSQIFMQANQMPILGLADQYLDPTKTLSQEAAPSDYPRDPIGALLRRNQTLQKDQWVVPSVVAFTDPNDLLSYVLGPSSHAQQAAYPIIDVIVSNDYTYFGLFENPYAAHMTYEDEDAVRQLIACGYPRSKFCP
jgi:hypothetical protein